MPNSRENGIWRSSINLPNLRMCRVQSYYFTTQHLSSNRAPRPTKSYPSRFMNSHNLPERVRVKFSWSVPTTSKLAKQKELPSIMLQSLTRGVKRVAWLLIWWRRGMRSKCCIINLIRSWTISMNWWTPTGTPKPLNRIESIMVYSGRSHHWWRPYPGRMRILPSTMNIWSNRTTLSWSHIYRVRAKSSAKPINWLIGMFIWTRVRALRPRRVRHLVITVISTNLSKFQNDQDLSESVPGWPLQTISYRGSSRLVPCKYITCTCINVWFSGRRK